MYFKIFHSIKDVSEWAEKYFSKALSYLQENETKVGTDANLIYAYCGSYFKVYNSFLRSSLGYLENDMIQLQLEIEQINKRISMNNIPEPIITYHYTNCACWKNCFVDNFAKNSCFVEKAFLSTSLIPEKLAEFRNIFKYNCLLKIKIPKGTKAIVIQFSKTRLKEYELLLPSGCVFRYEGLHLDWAARRVVCLCSLISQ